MLKLLSKRNFWYLAALFFATFIAYLYFQKYLFHWTLFYLNFKYDHTKHLSYWTYIDYLRLDSIPVLYFITLIVFLTLPLNKSFSLMLTLSAGIYYSNIVKMILRDPRPFWESEDIPANPEFCLGSFGGPNDSVLYVSSFYLSLYEVLLTYFSKSSTFFRLRKLIKGVVILLIILNVISKFFSGEGSIDQLIFGLLLGLMLYYFVYRIVLMHVCKPETFFKPFGDKIYSIICLYKIGMALLKLYLIIAFIHEDDFFEIIHKKCSDIRQIETLKFKSIIDSGFVFIVFGALYGVILLLKILRREHGIIRYKALLNWNQGSHFEHKRTYLSVILLYILTVIFIGYLRKKTNSLIVQFLLLMAAPAFIWGLFLFSILIVKIFEDVYESSHSARSSAELILMDHSV